MYQALGFPGAPRSMCAEGKHDTGHFRAAAEISNRAGNSDVHTVTDPAREAVTGKGQHTVFMFSLHAVKQGALRLLPDKKSKKKKS